ncbi:MAG: NAD(P)/FAD-dependent oxidoreductase [Verrucomicrobiota bacterium]
MAKPARTQKVLILGAGFAGLGCARKLAGKKEFEVTLVDQNNHHLFQPLLYQVASASLAAPDIARSIRQVLAKARNVETFMDEITAVDVEAKTATGAQGKVYSYDILVVATGAKTGYFGNDHWSEHTLSLKTLAESNDIRRTVLANLEKAEMTEDKAERKRLMTIAIAGGGPTGVELAGAFADLARRSLHTNFRHINTHDLRIVLIEGADRLLGVYDQDLSDYTKERLESLGVEVLLGKFVSDTQKGKFILQGGTEIEAGTLLWTAGVEATSLTRQLGVETDRGGRITPEPDLSLPGNRKVFVLGDIVKMTDVKGQMVPGVAPAAMQMGNHVAKQLITGERKPFVYFDKGNMAIIGKNHAVVQVGKTKLRGFIAWAAWLFIHILFLVGFRNKVSVLLGWAWAYLSDSPDTRIIVNTPRSQEEAKPASETGQSAVTKAA